MGKSNIKANLEQEFQAWASQHLKVTGDGEVVTWVKKMGGVFCGPYNFGPV